MNLGFIKNCLLSILVCLNCSLNYFAQTELPPGEVIERVTVQSDPTQSYALYLPKQYDPDKKWAVLYAFDPVARGKLPVTIFQEAAEKFGVIVVGSYNSRNGLDGNTLWKNITALWTDTHQRFSIEDRRVYAAGFSGGARVASIFAANCGCVTGVIGSGAGFSTGLKPSSNPPFIYFNAIGFDDYNYFEIRALRKDLEAAKMTHRVEKFDGAHQWLPKAVAQEALSWMQLYAMKKGLLTRDEKFIDETFQTRAAAAEDYLAKKQYLEAWQSFSSMGADFKELKDISEITKKVAELQKSDELKKAAREEETQINMQVKHANFILTTGYKLRDSEERGALLSDLRLYIGYLQKDADAAEDNSQRRIARRSLNQVFAETYEAAQFRYEREKKYDLALLNFELANEIYPKSPRIPFDRARVYALSGQSKKALEYLEKAVGFGFKNWQEAETETAFEKIRRDEKFQKLLAQMKDSK
jgi:tetratricopeptide (TPR) repeat protein